MDRRKEYLRGPVSQLMFLYQLAAGSGTLKSVSGNPISVSDALAKAVESLTVEFSPVQADGTPSLSNVLPISGWSNIPLYHGEDQSDYETITVALGNTCYAGRVDAVTGVGQIDGVLETVINDDTDGIASEHWYGSGVSVLGSCVRVSLNHRSASDGLNTASNTYFKRYCNMLSYAFSYASDSPHWYINNQMYLFLPVSCGTTLAEVGAWAAENPIQIYVPYATPVSFSATPQDVVLFRGTNVLWTDADSLTMQYKATT